MPDVNIPLLRKAVEWAEAEAAKPAPVREWEQFYYTLPVSDDDPRVQSMLFADYGWVRIARERMRKAPECGTCYCIAGFVDAASLETPSDYEDIEDSATALLGLSEAAADELFDGLNTIEDVRRIAEDIAGERL